MFIHSLRVHNFRNLNPVKIHLDPGFNVFIGANAQGKTNLLEAVVALSDGRSFRGAKLIDMIKQDSREALVEGVIRNGDREELLRIHFNKNIRQYYLNGKLVSDLKYYLGRINFVVFSAEYLKVADGEPRNRRDLLDRCVFSLDPKYLILLREYQKVLKSRNTVLKSENPDKELLEVYSQQLVDCGAQITCARLDYLSKITYRVIAMYREISGSNEELGLEYQSQYISEEDVSGIKAEDIQIVKTLLSEQMFRERDRDIFRGSTSVGPHRDDLKITMDGHEIRQYGSRGQKRTAVIAFKLSELQVYMETMGHKPVLILDDIIAELDEHRQKSLFEMIPEGIQTFVSHTKILDYFNLEADRYFLLNQGNLTRKNNSGLSGHH